MTTILDPVELTQARHAVAALRGTLAISTPRSTWRPSDWHARTATLQDGLCRLPVTLHALRTHLVRQRHQCPSAERMRVLHTIRATSQLESRPLPIMRELLIRLADPATPRSTFAALVARWHLETEALLDALDEVHDYLHHLHHLLEEAT